MSDSGIFKIMTDTQDIAARLSRAFRSFETIELTEAELPTSLAVAEQIEDAMIAKLGPIAAWKLGATHSSGLAKMGLPRFFLGALPAGRVAPARRVAGNWRDSVGVECEYAFRFTRDFAPGTTIDSAMVKAGIGGVHAAFEIPESCYKVGLGGYGGLAGIADDGTAGWLVIGEEIEKGAPEGLVDRPVWLQLDDKVIVEGMAAGRIDRFPYDLLADFARVATSRGHTIRAGHYVVPGSCTGYVPVPLGAPVAADFAGRAKVEAVFVEP
jgi:2-keto-4-pentenoate hydratase